MYMHILGLKGLRVSEFTCGSGWSRAPTISFQAEVPGGTMRQTVHEENSVNLQDIIVQLCTHARTRKENLYALGYCSKVHVIHQALSRKFRDSSRQVI